MYLSNLSNTLRNFGGTADFPLGTVVPYFGTIPALPGWSRWSLADNEFCLHGDLSSNPGTQITNSQGPSFTCSFGSAGGHTGSFGPSYITPYRFISGGPGFSPDNSTQFGNHTHATLNSGVISGLSPRRANFNFLVSTVNQKTLPANAMVFGNGNTNYGTEFTQSELSYISGVNGSSTISAGVQTQDVSRTASGAGSHFHATGSGTQFSSGTTTANFEHVGAGGHTHSIAVRYTQKIFGTTVIVRMYQLLNALSLASSSDIIVGFVGNTSLIQPPWYFCDGNNGTLDLNGKYLGLNSNLSPGTVLEPDLIRNQLTTNTLDSIFHGHDGFRRTGFNGTSFRHFYQVNLIWTHNHTLSFTYSDLPYIARRVNLRFIQYKG